ncbi:MAG: sulfatase-like hydrolase/transferase [Verrucomicrobiales bacterium]|nr:sulfatase-like hydrolase/transferase [Verrucomicrobiales bacterium]
MRLIRLALFLTSLPCLLTAADRPNVIFVMADDMGWGQTGYYNHPCLKTPNLDAMAANGLRFDRFYAGGPVCSPTRASVLTGRTPDRAGVLSHGYALRLQEKTISKTLQAAGYSTGHFGKWHLDGFKGPGAPIFADDPRGPGAFGFEDWVSVTNFFDVNPLMSRKGEFVQLEGDSSDVAVGEALKFIEKHHADEAPFFAIIWYGSPHSPYRALDPDKAAFGDLDEASREHYGELAAMDRSLGTLRQKLRDWGIADNTLLVFNSDNGGLPGIHPDTVGGLNGHKGSVYEGGVRVPAVIEWPARIKPRVTRHPACTMDLFPTVAEVLGLPSDVLLQPLDGQSLAPLFDKETGPRSQPIGFRYGNKIALIDNDVKILREKNDFELYDLAVDPNETLDLREEKPELFEKMKTALQAWNDSVQASFDGKDYPEGKVSPPDPESVSWYETAAYQPYLEQWKGRWEFERYLNPQAKTPKKPKGKKKAAKAK